VKRRKQAENIFYRIAGNFLLLTNYILYAIVKEVLMMADCIFCKIAGKEIPSTVVYEDETVLAFKDLEPQAPVHVLVIPKKHVESVAALKAEDKELAAHILVDVIPQIARDLGVAESGFRVVANTGDEGGQTVKHLHFHLLGGRSMQWPPG
jgi:histidine triad (HIT) family protein